MFGETIRLPSHPSRTSPCPPDLRERRKNLVHKATRPADEGTELGPHIPSLSVGLTAEFAERPDGYPAVTEFYGYDFAETRDLEPAILYEAVANGQVDVAFGFSTDGRILSYGLSVLDDDRTFFPPYEAAPVVRTAALSAHPELQQALDLLAGALPDSTVRRLTQKAEVGGEAVPEVAARFIQGLKRTSR